MNINRKYIIIFGTLILLLVIITGAITYYKEKAPGLVESPEQNEYFSLPIPKDKEYTIWCYENDRAYDCSNREFFQPGESVAITVNFTQFNNIPYDPYFLCYSTDLKGGLEKRCMSRSAFSLGGLSLTEGSIPQNKEVFTLLKVYVYPDDSFEELDEIVIMDLEGKLIK
jgi:hypothetical protein